MSDNPPKRLFKFRSWNREHDRLILEQNVLWFASPESLNDPFDCRIAFAYDRMSKKDFVDYLVHIAKSQKRPGSDAEIRAEAEQIAGSEPFRVPSRRRHDLEKWARMVAANYGVLSFAGVLDNILLWSHYADAHRGFCVEFDGDKLGQQFDDLFRTDDHLIMKFHVRYFGDYPVLIPTVPESEGIYNQRLTCKSDRWEYEREFRFIYVGRTNLARFFAPDCIVAVYLGCNMLDSDKQRTEQLVRDRFPNSALYHAKTKFDKFELEFDAI